MAIKKSPSLVGSMRREVKLQNTTRNLKNTGKSNYPSQKKETLKAYHTLINILKIHQFTKSVLELFHNE